MLTPERIVIALALALAMGVTAGGLIVRQRWRVCWGFAFYVVAVLAYNLGILLWPEQLNPKRFYDAWFWIAMSGVFDAARMWIALEIAWRVFRRAGDQRATLLVLGGIAVFTTAARVEGVGWGLWASDAWRPWMVNGALLIMTATLLIARWDRLRVDPFHRLLLTSFVTYLGLFSLWTRLYVFDPAPPPLTWKVRQYDPFAFVALACLWAWASWRPMPRNAPFGPTPATGENPSSGEATESARRLPRLVTPALLGSAGGSGGSG